MEMPQDAVEAAAASIYGAYGGQLRYQDAAAEAQAQYREQAALALQAALPYLSHETRLRRADLAIVKQAIEMLPATCHYHGDELLRGHGPWRDEACCDTGKPALARRKAEEALRRLEP